MSLQEQLKERNERLRSQTQRLNNEPMDLDDSKTIDNNNNSNNNNNNKSQLNKLLQQKSNLRLERNKKQNEIKNLKSDINKIDNKLRSLQNEINKYTMPEEDSKQVEITPPMNTPRDNDVEMTDTTDTSNNPRQLSTDEQLARDLQAQWDREDRSNSSNNVLNNGNTRISTFSSPNGNTRISYSFSTSSNNNNNNPTNTAFTSSLPDLISNDPFNSPFFTNSSFPSLTNLNRTSNQNTNPPNDIFSIFQQFNMNSGFPNLAGFSNIDNMSYEQLLQRFPNVPRGANRGTIEQLPTSEYKSQDIDTSKKDSKNAKIDENNKRCCICLDDFKDGDEIRRLPCLHIFHKDEIDNWLSRNHVCPICRHPIEEN